MRRFVLVFAFMAAAGGAEAADTYPYTGFFSSQPSATSAEDAQLSCAYSFFKQNDDGSFTGYEIDKPAFDADGTVRYEQYASGICTIDEDRVETCTISDSPEAMDVGNSYYDVLGDTAGDIVEANYFDSVEEATAFAKTGEGAPTLTARAVRCTGFDEVRLAGHLGDQLTRLSIEERGPLLAPDFDDQTRTTMRAILTKLGLSP